MNNKKKTKPESKHSLSTNCVYFIEMTNKVLKFVLLLKAFESFANGFSCAEFSSTNLPCVDVSHCNMQNVSLAVNKLANGNGASKSSSDVFLCYDDAGLNIQVSSQRQQYYSTYAFDECNDSVFNSDVVEVFIAPWYKTEPNPHCYSEIDLNPFNKLFESGIYNKNLNHTGITGTTFECGTSGVKHSTTILDGNRWLENLSIPWSVIDKPAGCPSAKSSPKSLNIRNLRESASSAASSVYRANFFRINELSSSPTCSSTSCEYLAWSPTGVNPPAFHEPTKFGYLVLNQ
jgi:hypothetical protein